MIDSRASEFATMLRAWRDRVPPVAAGLAAGDDRRVPGLRREELASLAGISVDYLVRLEQGRAVNPSTQVLTALARALQLSTHERDLLLTVARRTGTPIGTVPRQVSPGIRRLVDRLTDSPVAVYTSTWELIHWNPLWAALLGDPAGRDRRERNLAWAYFTHAGSRVRHTDEALLRFEKEMVADLRIAVGRYPDDRELVAMTDELRAGNPRFAELWDRFEVVSRVSGLKTIEHPLIGPITLDCDVLTAPDSDLRIVVYSAEPGSDDASSLELLRLESMRDLASPPR